MEKTIKQQIRSGFHLGAGAGGFLIAAILIGNGLGRILGLGGLHQIAWANWLGWAEVVLAVAILIPTARVWLMLLAGYMVFGVIKGVFLLATASFPSDGFSTRIEPLEITLYGVVSLVLLYRFAENPPTVLDRVALTVFFVCFLVPGSGPSPALSWSQMIGLAVLLASWGISRWRPAHDPGCNAHGVKAR